jgi:hypothetical protein
VPARDLEYASKIAIGKVHHTLSDGIFAVTAQIYDKAFN